MNFEPETKRISTQSTCISWKTYLPHMGRSVESLSFKIKGSNTKLKIITEWNKRSFEENYKIYLLNPKFGMHVSGHLLHNSGITFLFGVEQCSDETGFEHIMTLTLDEIKGLKMCVEKPITLLFDFGFPSNDITDILPQKPSVDETAKPLAKSMETQVEPSVHLSCTGAALEDIEKLFGNSEHSDAVVKCGDREFFVNRAILSTRSDVLEAMFRNKMAESQTGVLEIIDMDSSILEKFLRFVYTGKLNELCMDSAFHLYKTGDKYGVDSLKKLCASYMVDHLSEDNVYETLLLADMFNDTKLLENAISFAVKRNDMLESEAWNDFSENHPNLGVKVYKSFLKK